MNMICSNRDSFVGLNFILELFILHVKFPRFNGFLVHKNLSNKLILIVLFYRRSDKIIKKAFLLN